MKQTVVLLTFYSDFIVIFCCDFTLYIIEHCFRRLTLNNFLKYRRNRLLLESIIELPVLDFMNYQLVNKKTEILGIVTSHHRRSQDFWLGGAKSQTTCNDVIRNVEKGIFCGGKDIAEWKIRSLGLVLARN